MVDSESGNKQKPKKRKSLFLRLKGFIPYLGFILAILIIISQQTIWRYYEEIAGRLIIDIIRFETRGEFDITYDDVRFNLFTDHLVITDFGIEKLHQPNLSDTSRNEFELSSRGISLTVNSILDVIITQEIEITGINIVRPKLYIQSDRRVEFDESRKLASGELLDIIKGYLRDLKLEQVTIRNASIEYRRLMPENEIDIRLDSITLSIDQFEILNPLSSDEQTYLTSNIKFEILKDSISSIIPGHLITFERVSGSSFDSMLHLENIRVHPTKNAKVKTEYNIDFPELTISKLNYTEAVRNQGLLSGHLLLNNGEVNISSNQSMFGNGTSYGIPIRLDSISILNSELNISPNGLGNGEISVHSFDLKTDAIDLQSFDPTDFRGLIDTITLDFSTSHLEFPIGSTEHKVSVDTLHVNLPSRQVLALGVSSEPISNNLESMVGSSIASFEADKLGFSQLLFDQELMAERLVLRSANLSISDGRGVTPDPQGVEVDSLITAVNYLFTKVRIDQLAILNLGIEYVQSKRKSSVEIKRLDLNLNDILIDSTTIFDKTRIAGIKAIAVEGRDLNMVNDITTTRVKSKSFRIQPNPNAMTFDELSLTTTFPNNRSLSIGNLKMVGMDWYSLSHLQMLKMDSLLITRPDVSFSKLDTVYIPSDSLVISTSQGFLDSLLINHMSLNQGHLDIQNYNDIRLLMGETEVRAEDFKLKRRDDRLEWTSSFFYAENGPFSIILNPINHLIEGQGFTLSKVDSTLRLNQLKIGPLVSERSSNQLDVLVPNALMTGVDLSRMLDDNLLYARSLRFINPRGAIDLTRGGWHSIGQDEFIPIKNTKANTMSFQLDNLEFVNTSFQAQFNGEKMFHKSKIEFLDLSVHDLNFGPDTVIDSTLQFLSYIEVKSGSATYSGLPNVDSVMIGSMKWNSRDRIKLGDIRLSGVENQMRFKSTFPIIEVIGDGWLRKSLDREFSYDSLLIYKPIVIVEMDSLLKPDLELQENQIPLIQFSRILLDNGNLEYNNYDRRLSIPEFDGDFTDFNTGLGISNFMSTDFKLSVYDFRDILSGRGGKLHASEIQLSTGNSLMEVTGLRFEPSYSKYEYGKIVGKQTDWIDFSSSSIEFSDLKFWTLFDKKELNLGVMNISDANLDLYRDKNIPFPEDQVRHMPQDYIKAIPIPVKVDSIVISNLNVRYEELSPESSTPGIIHFSEINSTIRNITNDSLQLTSNKTMFIDATAKLMGEGELTTSFEFDLISEDQPYNVNGTLSEMALNVLNENLEPSWSVQITDGTLQKMNMNASGDTHYTIGEMNFLYDDLRLNLIGKKKGTTSAFGPSIGSFFANTFIVNKRNPRLLVARTGDIYSERDTARSFFNYLAKTTLSGVVSSIGASNNRKEIRKANKEAKDQAEKKKKSKKETKNKSATVRSKD